ncbi:hypothetical protein [Sphingobacterium spiritivorum]|uniref:hypothetical protein n=1 Tax=Sphingobacterium spiritivorum TaxID=258 RepID=UPI001F376CEA|nr:hypothetical protein [Sphingobacterium spiritivorum]
MYKLDIRATIYQNPGTNAVEVLQRDDYYSFGLQKSPNPVEIISIFISQWADKCWEGKAGGVRWPTGLWSQILRSCDWKMECGGSFGGENA